MSGFEGWNSREEFCEAMGLPSDASEAAVRAAFDRWNSETLARILDKGPRAGERKPRSAAAARRSRGPGYELLENDLTESTLWISCSKDARLLMITILSKMRGQEICRTPIPSLIHLARLTPEEGAIAMTELEAPDPDSKFPGHGGRRIVRIHDEQGRGLLVPSYLPRRKRYFDRERKAEERAAAEREPEDVPDVATVIAQLAAEGRSLREIAERAGVSKSTVQRILRSGADDEGNIRNTEDCPGPSHAVPPASHGRPTSVPTAVPRDTGKQAFPGENPNENGIVRNCPKKSPTEEEEEEEEEEREKSSLPSKNSNGKKDPASEWTLTLKDGSSWGIPHSVINPFLDELEYDVMAKELEKLSRRTQVDPGSRPTAESARGFVVNWLDRAVEYEAQKDSN